MRVSSEIGRGYVDQEFADLPEERADTFDELAAAEMLYGDDPQVLTDVVREEEVVPIDEVLEGDGYDSEDEDKADGGGEAMPAVQLDEIEEPPEAALAFIDNVEPGSPDDSPQEDFEEPGDDEPTALMIQADQQEEPEPEATDSGGLPPVPPHDDKKEIGGAGDDDDDSGAEEDDGDVERSEVEEPTEDQLADEQAEAPTEQATISEETIESLYFAEARNGARIIYDPEGRGIHASTHLADTPGLAELAQEAIAQTDVSGESVGLEVDLGREVGVSYMVPTEETDEIVYAKRPHRDTPMRFTMSREPEPSSVVTVILQQRHEGVYDLFSTWVGPRTPGFPGTDRETEESKPFWETHALVWGTQVIEPDTITTECPWESGSAASRPELDDEPTPVSEHDALAVSTKAELLDVLDEHDVPHEAWTGPKTADNLLHELAAGDSRLALDEAGGLRRLTSVAWIDVYADGPDGTRYKLVEDRQVFKHRFDDENNPIVRRRSLPGSIGEKVMAGAETPETPEQGARRGLREELGIVVSDNLKYARTVERETATGSYPGLITHSTNHYFTVETSFVEDGFVEDQPDKTTYFVWRPEKNT